MSDVHFECPKCKQPLDAPEELAAQLIECPTCNERIKVPVRSQREYQPQPPPIPRSSIVTTPGSLIVTTGNEVRGHPIERYLGVARGIVVRSPNIAQGMMGGLKQLVGGNIESYAKVCEESRRQAFDRMIEHAKAMAADAIIAMRYDATEFSQGVTEVLAYGTAVKLGPSSGESL
jgi:uncharacterized protein YbjQ (UPF0145 family)